MVITEFSAGTHPPATSVERRTCASLCRKRNRTSGNSKAPEGAASWQEPPPKRIETRQKKDPELKQNIGVHQQKWENNLQQWDLTSKQTWDKNEDWRILDTKQNNLDRFSTKASEEGYLQPTKRRTISAKPRIRCTMKWDVRCWFGIIPWFVGLLIYSMCNHIHIQRHIWCC